MKTRIYLTGISLGGNGAWKVATDYPDKFAAVIQFPGGEMHLEFVDLKMKMLMAFPWRKGYSHFAGENS